MARSFRYARRGRTSRACPDGVPSGGSGSRSMTARERGRLAVESRCITAWQPSTCPRKAPSSCRRITREWKLTRSWRRATACATTGSTDLEQRLDDTVSALYVTHYFGFPQPLEGVRRLCESRRLKLIEDCALSLFSRDNGTWLGSAGDLALFSVYKTLPVPHGGFLVTKSGQAGTALPPAPRASTFVQMGDLLQQGLRASGWGRVESWAAQASHQFANAIGWNRRQTICSGSDWDPRMLEYGASPWVARLMRFMDPEVVVARRRANYARLASHLRSHVSCPFPDLPAGTCPLFFPIMVPDRRSFHDDLEKLGVQSGNWWEISHPTCPPELAEEMAGWRRDCLELPIHQELSAAHIDRVAAAVLTVLARRAHGDDRRLLATEKA